VAANEAAEHDYGEPPEDTLDALGAAQEKNSDHLASAAADADTADDTATADTAMWVPAGVLETGAEAAAAAVATETRSAAEGVTAASAVRNNKGTTEVSDEPASPILDLNSHLMTDFFGRETTAEGSSDDAPVAGSDPLKAPALRDAESNGWMAQTAGTRQTVGKGTRGTGVSTLPPQGMPQGMPQGGYML
jgi:hypothetical protein